MGLSDCGPDRDPQRDQDVIPNDGIALVLSFEPTDEASNVRTPSPIREPLS
jgi:hypothetical protein